MERDDGPGVRRVLSAIALLVAVFLASLLGIQPPRAVSAQAPADQFSAGRALNLLASLMGNDTPHPIGSDANAAVRNRILEEFTKLGYTPQTQSAFDCDDYGGCATVQNVVARLDGAQQGPAVLLAAHYDSVAAGPGVSDDGVGAAAVLEIARALKSLPVPLHRIIFLIDDGEEAGLLGAQAFVDFHPWANEVKAAVNVDARGTSGPSLMFETGSANDWAVGLYAYSVARPATTSIAYTAYKLLPNDTDFSVFKSAGYQGLNFALIGSAPIYHTPLDNLQNVNPASLQHQGDNALAAIRALANSDLSDLPGKRRSFFRRLRALDSPLGGSFYPAVCRVRVDSSRSANCIPFLERPHGEQPVLLGAGYLVHGDDFADNSGVPPSAAAFTDGRCAGKLGSAPISPGIRFLDVALRRRHNSRNSLGAPRRFLGTLERCLDVVGGFVNCVRVEGSRR